MSFEENKLGRKDFERLLQRSLTHAQYKKLQDTERYLNSVFDGMIWESMSASEKTKLVGVVKQQNQDVWDVVFAGCVSDAIVCFPALSTKQRTKYAWNKAEMLMIQEFYSPPHYTKSGSCAQCGPVLLPQSCIDTRLERCPWCSIDILIDFNETKNGEEKTYEQ